jgi:MFS family permease
MTVLVAARFFEGAGAAALGAIAVSGIAALYEEPQRPKVMVLGNLAWVIPSVAGPALGSLAVATVGWRWASTAQLPLLVVAMVLIAPGLGLLKGRASGPADGPERGVVGPSLALFCCAFAFFAVDGFVPLLQARLARRGWTPPRLLAVGGALVMAGTAGTAFGLLPGAWLAPYLAWTVGGFGMGLAYTGAWLATMAAQQSDGGGAVRLAGRWSPTGWAPHSEPGSGVSASL